MIDLLESSFWFKIQLQWHVLRKLWTLYATWLDVAFAYHMQFSVLITNCAVKVKIISLTLIDFLRESIHNTVSLYPHLLLTMRLAFSWCPDVILSTTKGTATLKALWRLSFIAKAENSGINQNKIVVERSEAIRKSDEKKVQNLIYWSGSH